MGAGLDQANFMGANLSGAQFVPDTLDSKTNISGANLEFACLAGTTFDHVIYDSKTKFPVGFRVEDNGLILKVT